MNTPGPNGSLTLDGASVQRLMDYGLLHYTSRGWIVGKWKDAVDAEKEPTEQGTH